MLLKLLVAALIFLSLMLLGLLWLVAVLAKIPLWIPGSVTALIFLIIVLVFVFRAWRAQRAASGLESALAAQAAAQSKSVRPDLQIEMQQMQEEFDRAVGSLKKAKAGGRGRDALYFLPWYAIIGPPGAGKSTALRNSGLSFPYTSKSGNAAVKGLGGTRNCDWWLTNEAVLLDTAGRWSTQEEDHDEWLSFLSLLRKYRARKPLNGLITAISIGEIARATEDEIDALATRMRERLDEVHTQLRVSIPAYVLFTKCDLVEGFHETFGELKKTERNQVWGFTLPLSEKVSDQGARLAECFDELCGVLDPRSLARMGDERSIDKRVKIYAFPQQFLMLRRNLTKFVSVMFQANIYQQTPALRGVYFTSGTQEGRPFSLLINRLAEALGSRRHAASEESVVVDQKSYFLHDVFRNVIFEDRDVASASEAELRSQRWRRLGLTTVLGLVSIVVGLIPSYAWSLNKLQLSRIHSALEEWEAPAQRKLDYHAKLQRLEPLRKQLNTLVEYDRNGAPMSMRLGMYNGSELIAPLRRYYANLLRRELVQPMVAADLDAMTDVSLRYASVPQAKPSAEELSAYYDVLKLHLELTQPKTAAEPKFDATQQAWVKARLMSRFTKFAGNDEELKQAPATNAQLYVDFMSEFPELAFTRDKEVVHRLRAVLNRVPATARALQLLIAAAETEDYGLNLSRLIGANNAIRETSVIRGAFTRRGFDNIVRDRLSPDILEDAGELWVLGLAENAQQASSQRAAQVEQLRNAYFKAYIDEWRTFLSGLHVDRPRDHAAALELLRELSRGMPPPIALLITRTHDNVTLKPKPTVEGLAQAAGSNVMDKLKGKLDTLLGDEHPKPGQGKASQQLARLAASRREPTLSEHDVAKAFEGFSAFAVPPDTGDNGPRAAVPFDVYQEQLYFVRDALQKYLDNPGETSQLQSRMADARVRVRNLIDQQAVGFRPLFEALLWPPIDRAVVSSTTAIASNVSDGYCTAVYAEFRRTIAGHYPFNRDGQDLPLTDFTNFYRPKDGRVWAFAGSKLTGAIKLEGDRYTFVRELGQETSANYATRLLEFLQASQDITRSYYPTDSVVPSIDFEIRVHPSPSVALTQFTVGGKMVEHYNGPERWKALSWPGAQPESGASIVIRGANGMHEVIRQSGPWALFRLLEAGTLLPGAGKTFTVAWQLQTHDVTLQIDFEPKRGESPFLGVPGHSSRNVLLQPVRVRAAEAPSQIVGSAHPCN